MARNKEGGFLPQRPRLQIHVLGPGHSSQAIAILQWMVFGGLAMEKNQKEETEEVGGSVHGEKLPREPRSGEEKNLILWCTAKRWRQKGVPSDEQCGK